MDEFISLSSNEEQTVRESTCANLILVSREHLNHFLRELQRNDTPVTEIQFNPACFLTLLQTK